MPDLHFEPAYQQGVEPITPAPEEQAAIARAFEGASSVFGALSTLRTRRMGLGYQFESGEPETFEWSSGRTVTQPAGPLAYASSAPPVPLSEVEEALLAWAALGPNGVVLADVPVQGGLAGLVSWAGRTIPASSNDLSVDLFVINDEGVWLYRPAPERLAAVEIAGPDDYWKILHWYRNDRVQVSDRRPDVGWFTAPEGTHNVNALGAGQYNLNRPGSTWFLPVGDVGLEWFNMLLASYEWSGFYLMDPDTQKSTGVEDFIRPGFLEVGFPVPVFDDLVLLLHASQAACSVQNIRLASEALGLGAWPVGSYADDLVLGAYPEVAVGLGFDFLERDPDTNPSATVTCLGKPGVKEPVVVPSPQFPTAADAVRYVRSLRYGPGGQLSRDANWAERNHGPYQSESMREIIEHPKAHIADWVEQAAVATVEYIVAKHGCCPAYVNPVRAKFSAQVHHVDVEYYRRFTTGNGRPYSITDAIAGHFADWHPGMADPTGGER
ncbi:MAG: hypothetical protein JJLCMIEE_00011 [Acidimicrobiales bacterium]|nr:hypothetical protein [Acidimicrobiales bacterium]